MKVSFYIYCRAPLGRLLGKIVERCERMPGGRLKRLLLTSRQSREDLPREEILRSAVESASDSCDIVLEAGEVGMAWLYGARHDVPRMWGTLNAPAQDIGRVSDLLTDLSLLTQGTYAVCDLYSIRTAALLANEVDRYESEGLVSALYALHWWNYFGSEYQGQLPVTDGIRAAATEVRELEDGGLIVLTRKSPKDPVDPERIAKLVREWPVFRKYDYRAGFKNPVRIDYSAVWNLPPPAVLVPQPIATTVGPPDEFIAAVATLAASFEEWARRRGLTVPQTEEDFVSFLQEHELIIRDEALVPTIAAYGELVRSKIGGSWSKAVLLNRGEPVVVKPGRPWTARRVILEVLEGLEPVDK